MYIVADLDPTIEARQAADPRLPARLWGLMADAWLRRLDRQTERAVQRVGHEGVMEDYRQASRRW